jgi:hypothetical protein
MYLGQFINYGLVAKRSRYSYASTGWRQALPACVVAIEAKLSKWHEVLQQAIDNQVFADETVPFKPSGSYGICSLTPEKPSGDLFTKGVLL